MLRLKAQQIRKERTGIHASVYIMAQSQASTSLTTLAWSLINIEKGEERTRLVNSAYVLLSAQETATAFPKTELTLLFNRFCEGLWEQALDCFAPENVAGDDLLNGVCYLLKPYVIHGGGTILFGPPGRGKSFIGLAMGISLDAGIEKFWEITMPMKTLIINLERSRDSVAQRIGRINRILGLPQTRSIKILNARGKSLLDIADSTGKTIQRDGIEFVLLDSISRSGFGDLNENRPVNAIIDCLNNLCPSWLAIGHSPRASEDHVFGSIHFEAGADIVVQTLTQEKTPELIGVGLQIVKANDVPKVRQQAFALEFEETGIKNIRLAQRWEFLELSGKQKMGMEETIMDYLGEVGKASATQIAKALEFNRSNVSTTLKHSRAFVEVSKETGRGGETLYGLAYQ